MIEKIDLRKIFHLSLFWFLAISTFFYCPVPQGHDPIEWGYISQELFVRYGIIFLFGLSLFVRPMRDGLLKWPGMFLAYVVFFGALMNFDIQTRRSVLNLFFGVLFYKLIVDYFDFKHFRGACWTMFVIILLNVILCTFQTYRADPLFSHAFMENIGTGMIPPVGLMRLQAHLGTMAALLAPWLFYLNPLYVLLCLPLLFYGFSSFAIVAFMVSVGFLLFFRMRRSRFLLVLGVMAVLGVLYILIFDMPSGQFDYRFKVWFMGLKQMLPRSPFFGLGLGSWARMSIETAQKTNDQTLTWLWAHNEYLQVFIETGVIGFVIMACWIRSFFKMFNVIKTHKIAQALFASFLSLLIVCVGHFPFHLGRFAAISIFIIAIFHAFKVYVHGDNENEEIIVPDSVFQYR